jgi:hypothetical protein
MLIEWRNVHKQVKEEIGDRMGEKTEKEISVKKYLKV